MENINGLIAELNYKVSVKSSVITNRQLVYANNLCDYFSLYFLSNGIIVPFYYSDLEKICMSSFYEYLNNKKFDNLVLIEKIYRLTSSKIINRDIFDSMEIIYEVCNEI